MVLKDGAIWGEQRKFKTSSIKNETYEIDDLYQSLSEKNLNLVFFLTDMNVWPRTQHQV